MTISRKNKRLPIAAVGGVAGAVVGVVVAVATPISRDSSSHEFAGTAAELFTENWLGLLAAVGIATAPILLLLAVLQVWITMIDRQLKRESDAREAHRLKWSAQ